MAIQNNENQKNREVKTTGHDWDGIQEYNIPTPRWWLIVWIICIIWAIIYWFFYPAWPTISGNSKGSLNWTKYSELKNSQEVIKEKKDVYLKKFSKLGFEEIMKDPQMMEYALNGGRAIFKENCAACHGVGANGAKGYPNLNDDDWLWGGKIDDIHQTLLYGIRSGHDKARFSQMPSFGLDQILSKKEIEDVAEYVLSLSKKGEYNKNGELIFKQNCVACHTASGKGNKSLGAPNLTDSIWLYGSDKEDVLYSIYFARAGVMPYWSNRLDSQQIRQVSIYVHSLGGGEK